MTAQDTHREGHGDEAVRSRGRQPRVGWSDAVVRSLVEAREQGVPLSVLAAEYGVSRERVRQVLVERGHSSLSNVAAQQRAEERSRRDEEDRQRIRELLAEDSTRSWARIGVMLGLTRSRVMSLVGEQERSMRTGGAPARRTYTDEALIQALQAAQKHYGSRTLTYAQYAQWSAGKPVPSPALVAFRFGTWSAALSHAGVPANTSRRKRTAPRLRNMDLVGWVALAIQDAGASTAASYDRWARQVPGAPSSSLIRHRLGWSEVRSHAEKMIAENRLPDELRPVYRKTA